ncbi:putative membrane protein [Streptacidiphilus sp. BW17]
MNDPATAVQALDSIEGLLRRLLDARLDAASVPGENGAVRVVLALPTWGDFLRTGLDDLCCAALDSPMVLARAARLMRDLLEAAPPQRGTHCGNVWRGSSRNRVSGTHPSWAAAPPSRDSS